MLTILTYNLKGEETGTMELPEKIFGLEINNDLIYQAVNTQLASHRKSLAQTKDRSEVRGGGRKPWRQKGTGRARHGSIRSPIWRGGGVTFGPRKEKVFAKKINKKAKTKAFLMALSSKVKDKELIVLDKLELEKSKTKLMANILEKVFLSADKAGKKKKTPAGAGQASILIATSKKDEKIIRANRNLPYTKTIAADSLNIIDLLSFKYLLLDKEAIKKIEKTYVIV
jgi:large subunit ribosomal protein L4